MTTTPNPTAEPLKSWEVNDKAWDAFSAEEHLTNGIQAVYQAGLRAHGLLSEGAPSEEQLLAALNAYQRTDHDQNGIKRPYVYAEGLDDWGPQTVARMRAALTAARVAPQEPSVLAGRCRTCGGEVLEGTAEDVIDFLDNPSPDREELAQREAEEYAPGDHEAPDDFLTGWRTADRNALAAQPVLDPERVKTWLQREFGSVLAHDPHNPEQFWGGSARALCEAAKRGELTC